MNAPLTNQPDMAEPITEPALKPEDTPTVVIDTNEPIGNPDQDIETDDTETESDEDPPTERLKS